MDATNLARPAAFSPLDVSKLPRFRLAHLPTPMHPLKRLSAYLGGPEIWIKRDDCTGLAVGGNKTRKLEFLIGDAIARGADTIVTVGGIQSNHTRQTAAAAAIAGLRCELVVRRWVPWDDPNYERVGNILFSRLFGAHVNIAGGVGRVGTAEPEFTEIMERAKAEGRNPYAIPAGGSDHPLGGIGYALCAQEIAAQAQEHGVHFDAIVHATSSGSTQAGLLAGLTALAVSTPVIGIEVDDEPAYLMKLVPRLARQTLELLGLDGSLISDNAIHIRTGYQGTGYGLPTEATVEAIRTAATLEGLLLDPVYEGKAMQGLIDMVRRGEFKRNSRILYINLGGIPALHAYASIFEHEPGAQGAN